MKKIAKYTALFVFSLLWVAGCHPFLRRTAFEWGLTKDSYRYGDLYRLSNLAQFKQPAETCPKKFAGIQSKKNAALYIIGDSFTEEARVNADDFNSTGYRRIHWNDSLRITLDTTKRNILVLQTVERHFREHFAVPVHQFEVVSSASPQVAPPPAPSPSLSDFFTTLYNDAEKTLKESEESLASFLFSGDVFLRLKEIKAGINLQWFDRHSEQVALSPDKKHILFHWDTDSTRITSSFHYLPDNELLKLVQQVNQTEAYYKKMGFDAVYLSLIPNKTSILAPEMGPYNHLVERVQHHPLLKTPFIDSWTPFSQYRAEVYSLSDTHWSCQGRAIWLEKVNEMIRK
ncbi:MAG: hypothetical protein U0X91_17415 [Spirosomataceae bacterium]